MPVSMIRPAALLRRASRVFSLIGGVALAAMAVVTFADVTGRYLFSRPIPGATEVNQALMVFIVAGCMASVTLQRQHVTMSLLSDSAPAGLSRLLDRTWMLLGAGTLVGLAAVLLRQALALGRDGTASIFLGIPIAPLAWLLVIGFMLAAVVAPLASDKSAGEPPPGAER